VNDVTAPRGGEKRRPPSAGSDQEGPVLAGRARGRAVLQPGSILFVEPGSRLQVDVEQPALQLADQLARRPAG
jgi:hypothetical protein